MTKIKLNFLLASLCFLVVSHTAYSKPQEIIPEFANIPTTISVTMYRLEPGGVLPSSPIKCQPGSQTYGCTAIVGNPTYAYPYSSSTVNVSVENDYLLDVLHQEMSVGIFPPSALKAQAIAARTLAYHRSNYGANTINNSNAFQVFLPYNFERLNQGVTPNNALQPCASTNLNLYQRKTCAALFSKNYITNSSNDLALFTEFFNDAYLQTTDDPTKAHQNAVSDPISYEPAIAQKPASELGHGRGLSTSGAGRWAYGNSSFKGTLTDWSVKWHYSFQILTHYYTGIQIRNTQGKILTPAYRWNPLKVTWNGSSDPAQPPKFNPGTAHTVQIQVQNTGTVDFNSTVRLSCRWQKLGGSAIPCAHSVSLSGLAKGKDALKTLTVQAPTISSNFQEGPYLLLIDAKVGNSWFRDREAGRYWPSLPYLLSVGRTNMFLPGLHYNCPVIFHERFEALDYPLQVGSGVTHLSSGGVGDTRAVALNNGEYVELVSLSVPPKPNHCTTLYVKYSCKDAGNQSRFELYVDGHDVTPGFGAANMSCSGAWDSKWYAVPTTYYNDQHLRIKFQGVGLHNWSYTNIILDDVQLVWQ